MEPNIIPQATQIKTQNIQAQPEILPPKLPHLALINYVNPFTFSTLSENDDRLQIISDYFRTALITKPATSTGTPEIEARMGKYMKGEKLSGEENALADQILMAGYFQVLPFRQDYHKAYKNLFRFVSGVREDHFNYLISLFEETAQKPKSGVINRGKKVQIDLTYNNGIRVSKDIETGKISEVISKNDRTDINLQNRGEDIRISSSIEQKHDEKDAKGTPKQTRTKTRFSYDYEFMGFDLTCVKSASENPTFEVELEIRDVSFMLKFKDSPLDFKKLVLRFVANLQSLYHVIKNKYSEHFGDALIKHYKEQYGEESPMPVVGGYLGCMAHRKNLNFSSMKVGIKIGK